MRGGFSLITAIMIMLIISIAGVAILSLSNMSMEQKGQAFMKSQAELIAKSATEYAIKDALFNGYSMPRDIIGLKSGKRIDINASQYNIRMDIQFVGSSSANDAKNYGVMLIDTAVETTIEDMPIRFVKRTVQRL